MTPAPPFERRNLALLALSQVMLQTNAVVMVTIAGLIGLALAPRPSLATLPVALTMVATAATMIPASLLMQRRGRRAGFLVGTGIGVLAGALATAAVTTHHFALFCAATMLIGVYQAFGNYYRFAAAEAVAEARRSRAISWVISAGVAAAIAGPVLVRETQDLATQTYAATLLVTAVLALAAMALVANLRLAPPSAAVLAGPARPLWQIVVQPVFLTALACSSAGYAVMVLVMTATPLAMLACGFPVSSSATVIQWHVLGMFVPAFFTGSLIDRVGVLPVIVAGLALLTAEIAVAVAGVSFAHFITSLVLLGVGWNFLFIGGTTLLTRAYRPAERAKTQAAHDFVNFGAMSVASLSAGGALSVWGWEAVNKAAAPLLAVALLAVGVYAFGRMRTARQPAPR